MRKHDVRKWLHAVLDLLPVILIPVFMIYSHRHEINDGSIEVRENVIAESNVVETYQDLRIGNIYRWTDSFVAEQVPYNGNWAIDVNQTLFKQQFPQYDGEYSRIVIYQDSNTNFYYRLFPIDGGSNVYYQINSVPSYFVIESLQNITLIQDVVLEHIVYTDKVFILGQQYVTYDDTDIMSQMTYQLYNSVDKYFNMGNVFNLGGLYDWFNLNIFNGQAPIYIYIVWQIALYELVMDLLFLLYGLFMWFIDMVTYLMDKPFKSIK